jgi:hypothetical protein
MTAMSVNDLMGMLRALAGFLEEHDADGQREAIELNDTLAQMDNARQADFYFLETDTDNDTWEVVSVVE